MPDAGVPSNGRPMATGERHPGGGDLFRLRGRLQLHGRLGRADGSASTGGPSEVGLVGVRFGGDTAATRVVLDLDAAISGAIVADESTGGHLVFALPPLLSTGPLQGHGPGAGHGLEHP